VAILSRELMGEATRQSAAVLRDFLKRAQAALTDSRADVRRARGECAGCFYARGPVVAQRGMSRYGCESCGQEKTHANGRPPRLCVECSTGNSACRRCLAAVG